MVRGRREGDLLLDPVADGETIILCNQVQFVQIADWVVTILGIDREGTADMKLDRGSTLLCGVASGLQSELRGLAKNRN